MSTWNIDAARIAKVRGLPLDEALAKWDRGQDEQFQDQANQQRSHVLEVFPIAGWPDLPLERYALGTEDDESFCKLMEFRTGNLGGIGGGSALKHLIYRRQDGSWYYRPEYSNETEAWAAVRDGFVRAFELAQAGEWSQVDQVPSIKPASSLRGKAMFVYFPDELIPIYAASYQAHFYAALGGQGSAPDGVSGCRALLELARSSGRFDGWQPLEISRFLGAWSDPRVGSESSRSHPATGRSSGMPAERADTSASGGTMSVT